MNRDQFISLSKDHQIEIVKSYTEGLSYTVNARMGILPSISALAAALLIIASFNFNQIVELGFYTKILLSILLLLIPFSLFLYNQDLKTAQERWKGNLEEILPGSKKREEEIEKTFLNKLTAYFPDIAIGIIALVCFSMIYMIWPIHISTNNIIKLVKFIN